MSFRGVGCRQLQSVVHSAICRSPLPHGPQHNLHRTLYGYCTASTRPPPRSPSPKHRQRARNGRPDEIPSIPIPSSSLERGPNSEDEPIRASSLYNSLVRGPISAGTTHRKRRIVDGYNYSGKNGNGTGTGTGYGGVAPTMKTNSKLHARMREYVRGARGVEAHDALQKERTPDARAVIMGIDACVAAGRLGHAERLLGLLRANVQNPALSDAQRADQEDGLHSARNILCIAYTTKGSFDAAAALIGLPHDYKKIVSAPSLDKAGLERMLRGCSLGRDAVSWGIIIKILTKVGQPFQAVAAVDVAMQAGIHMTDSLLHLTIDALRLCGKWREALWLFKQAVDKGLSQPHERTLASMLLTLVSKHARDHVDRDEIISIIDMAYYNNANMDISNQHQLEQPYQHEPSLKFLSAALMSLSSIGYTEKAEEIFTQIRQRHGGDTKIDEFVYSCMMATYMNYAERVLDKDLDIMHDETRREATYIDLNSKVDALWAEYSAAHLSSRPSGMKRTEREGILSKLLRVKTRTFRTSDGIAILEALFAVPYHDVRIFHVTALMGAVELASNVPDLLRLLDLMQRLGLRHDMRSVAFAVGTYVGDGNLGAALDMARKHVHQVVQGDGDNAAITGAGTGTGTGTSGSYYKQYYPALLGRRLQMLSDALKEAGVERVADLDEMIAQVEAQRTSANLNAKRPVAPWYQ